MPQSALLTASGTQGIFLNYASIWWLEKDMKLNLSIANLTQLNQCYPFGTMFSKPLQGVAAPFNPHSCQRGPNVATHKVQK